MTSKTHISTGIALASAITLPGSLKSFAICITAATIGSIISDIDVTTSTSHKELTKILTISVIAIILCTLAETFFQIGIMNFILGQTNLSRMLIGFFAFLLICAFGMNQPHRTFMHSFLCLIVLSAIVCFMLPGATLPFAIGMFSHIFLDLFNKKKIQLFYPHKWRFAFRKCPANGKVNNRICAIASSLCLIEVGFLLALYFHK